MIEEPTIKIDINDYGLAAPGGEITITGLGFDQTKIEVSGIENQLTQKLAGGKAEKKTGRANRGKDAPPRDDDNR